MKTKQYSNIGPALFIPQALGAVAGGVGGFLKARREAKASGEKVTFKNAWDDVLLGAGKGALNPLSGAAGLATQGLGSVNDKQQQNAAMVANANANVEAAAAAPPVAFDPLGQNNTGVSGMGGIVDPNDPTGASAFAAGLKKGKVQNSSFNNNPVFSPSSAGLMMGIYKK